MKIILADHFGTCFGVRDAIAQAEALAAKGPLTILGELVHNPIVRERLRDQGVVEASLDAINSIAVSPMDTRLEADSTPSRVMITAHGASDGKRDFWRKRGLEVFDGTCPLVRHAHEQLKQLVCAGYFPVVIGKPGHVEVRGLIEDFPEGCVVETAADIENLPHRARYGIISQTTQPIERVHGLVAAIQHRNPASEVRFVDTVCRPTKDRQLALRKLIVAADVIVVVGGHYSNNTRQLAETCRSAGKWTFHIERPEELKPHWFSADDVVGLTAGTSTLPETVEAVHARLLEMANG